MMDEKHRELFERHREEIEAAGRRAENSTERLVLTRPGSGRQPFYIYKHADGAWYTEDGSLHRKGDANAGP